MVRHFQHIAHAAHGLDQARLEILIDLASQTPDRDLDDIGVAVEIHVPHLRGNQRARQHFTVAAHQQFQQAEFLGGQVNALPGPAGAPAQQVQFQIGHPQQAFLIRAPATAQDAAHARQQFGKGKRLDQVIIGTQLQALDPIIDLIARGQEHHRHA